MDFVRSSRAVRSSLARSSVNSRRRREDAHPGGRRPLSVVADPGPPSCRRLIFRRSSPPRSTGGNARVVARASCSYARKSSGPGRAACEECGWSGESARSPLYALRAETKIQTNRARKTTNKYGHLYARAYTRRPESFRRQ